MKKKSTKRVKPKVRTGKRSAGSLHGVREKAKAHCSELGLELARQVIECDQERLRAQMSGLLMGWEHPNMQTYLKRVLRLAEMVLAPNADLSSGVATIHPAMPMPIFGGRKCVVVGIIGSKKVLAICGYSGAPDEKESIANAIRIATNWNERNEVS